MMNYVYQTLKHIAEFTLERQRWKEREREAGLFPWYINFACKRCLVSSTE